MDSIKSITALGLVSSSSLDGVEAALIQTDGVDIFDFIRTASFPYDELLREQIRSFLGKAFDTPPPELLELETALTNFHAEIVREFMSSGYEIDVIGFYGHTIFHNPAEHYTHQAGNGQLLADLTGIKVVNRFSRADVSAGGQGFPLLPVFDAAMSAPLEKPVAVLNIGGIASVTWIGSYGELLAFDTGPGNVAINDWVYRHGGQHMDYNGKLAITGKIDGHVLASMMRHKYFAKYPPKSVDRNAFKDKLEHLEGLNLADGAATATAFVAESIAYSLALYLPEMPQEIIVCGGGAKNPTLLRFLRQRLENVNVKTAGELGWNCEAFEAQAIAFLAVRRLHCLPITFPGTTGVVEPMVGGEISLPI